MLELSVWERRSWTRQGLARWSGDDEKGKELAVVLDVDSDVAIVDN